VKVAAGIPRIHNHFGEDCWASCLRENLTSSSYGEELETGREYAQEPRQSFTRQIFFKTIKRNLRIKTFVGTSPNALIIQIWTALIAVLTLKYLKFRSLFQWSLSNLVAMLRYNLFRYRNLWAWIDQPFEPPPVTMMPEQLSLNWTAVDLHDKQERRYRLL